MTREIRKLVKGCNICSEMRRVPVKPLKTTPFPERPWWRLATDVLEHEGDNYIVVVDYFSRFIDAKKLDTVDSSSINYLMDSSVCLVSKIPLYQIMPHIMSVSNSLNSALNGIFLT